EGIDDGEENDMGRHRQEVVDAFRGRVLQIRKPDLADDWISRAVARTRKHMEILHSKPPSPVLRTVARLEVTNAPLPALITREPRPVERRVARPPRIVFTVSRRFSIRRRRV